MCVVTAFNTDRSEAGERVYAAVPANGKFSSQWPLRAHIIHSSPLQSFFLRSRPPLLPLFHLEPLRRLAKRARRLQSPQGVRPLAGEANHWDEFATACDVFLKPNISNTVKASASAHACAIRNQFALSVWIPRRNLLLCTYCGPILCPRSETHCVLHLCDGSKLGIRVTVLISLFTNTSIKTRTLKHSQVMIRVCVGASEARMCVF